MHDFLIWVVLCHASSNIWVRVVYRIRVDAHKPLLPHSQAGHNQAVVEHFALRKASRAAGRRRSKTNEQQL
jgi:hypothetical protein